MRKNRWMQYYKQNPEEVSTSAGGGDTVSTEVSNESAGEASNDWGTLVDDGGDGVDTSAGQTPVEKVDATPAEVKPEVQAVAEPAVATQPVQPQQPTQAPVEQPVAAPAAMTQEELSKLRNEYHTQLAAFYRISPEDAQRLQTEPENVLPQLAANVHLEVMDAISAQIPMRIQSIVTQVLEARERESSAKEAFMSAFPDLREHEAAVLQVGKMFRAANPKAPKDVAIKQIGDFVRQSLGLSAPAAVAPVATAPNPFKPALAGGGAAPTQPVSEWEELVNIEL
jgi:hypothetical protein